MTGSCNISLAVAAPATIMLGSLPAQLEVDKALQVREVITMFR